MMNGATIEGPLPETETLSDIDKWILSRLAETTAEYSSLLESYEFARACESIYHFAWDDLCDWYLELSKENFASGNAAASQRVLGHILDTLFRLLHPVMPFITETMWTTLTGGETLMTTSWPIADSAQINKKSEALVAELQKIITEVRRFRNDQGVKPSQKIPGRIIAPADVTAYSTAMAFLLKLELTDFTPSASVEIGSMKVELDLSGTVDVVAERARLEKDLATAQKDMKTAEVKLNNEGFMAKAPAQVVAEIKERMAATSADIERITAQLAALK
jgi:valyl-tRNA synthetase